MLDPLTFALGIATGAAGAAVGWLAYRQLARRAHSGGPDVVPEGEPEDPPPTEPVGPDTWTVAAPPPQDEAPNPPMSESGTTLRD